MRDFRRYRRMTLFASRHFSPQFVEVQQGNHVVLPLLRFPRLQQTSARRCACRPVRAPDDNHTPGTEAVQLPGWYSLSVWPVNWDL
jgi:hypothetical protein